MPPLVRIRGVAPFRGEGPSMRICERLCGCQWAYDYQQGSSEANESGW